MSRKRARGAARLLAAAMAMTMAGAAAQTPTAGDPVDIAGLTGQVIVDGSSTVWPIAVEAAERFDALGADLRFDVEVSGTGGGFRRFCDGASDVQNASRPISAGEAEACAAAGVEPLALPVGLDGVTVVVSPENAVVSCLTVEQLAALWRPDAPARTWRELDPAWPDQPIELFGPGPDSGTFDFFTEAIVGEAGLARADYTPSENDYYLVEEVATEPNALGFFGFAYAEGAGDRLKEVAIDGGNGCVAPSAETINEQEYAPLSRPLFLYADANQITPQTAAFLDFALSDARSIVEAAGYVPLDDEAYVESLRLLREAVAAGG